MKNKLTVIILVALLLICLAVNANLFITTSTLRQERDDADSKTNILADELADEKETNTFMREEKASLINQAKRVATRREKLGGDGEQIFMDCETKWQSNEASGISVQYNEEKPTIVLEEGTASYPAISPGCNRFAFIDGYGWEVEGTLTVFDVNTKEIQTNAMPDIPEQHTPSFLAWLDDRYLLVIVKYAFGTLSPGGEVYLFDAAENTSRKLVMTKELTQIVSITMLGNEYVVLELAVFDANMITREQTHLIITVEEIYTLISKNTIYNVNL